MTTLMDTLGRNANIIVSALFVSASIGFLCFYPVTNAGIKCWVCNSYNDVKCGDPFDNTTFPITDCDSETGKRENLGNLKATMCRKMTQKVNGTWRFIRSCAFLGEPGIGGDERYCKRRTGTYNIYQEDCLCRGKDGCNEASLFAMSSTAFWASLLTVLCLSKTIFSSIFI